MAGGGAERITATLANHFMTQGHSISVVTFSRRDSDAYTFDAGVRRIRLCLDYVSQNAAMGILNNLRRVIAIRSAIREASPHVVFSMMDTTNVLAILATRGLSIPIVVSERTHPPMYPLGWFWETLRKWTYPLAHRVVVLTADTLDWLRRSIPSATGLVIPNPVVYPLPKNEPLLDVSKYVQPGRKVILAAGRMDEGKQFDLLISAFHSLHSECNEWDLVILGDGPLRPALELQIKQLALNQRVHMPGRAGNIGDWYAKADLYVLSSRFEGFPNVIIEAMAHGCPVVSYDCDTGPRDIIRHGVDGLLVHPVGDVPALQTAMKYLMTNSSLRLQMSSIAPQVLERFSVETVMFNWDRLIKSAVKLNGSSH
jgi:glycosyltransferase involved in cell wall biosynthesis